MLRFKSARARALVAASMLLGLLVVVAVVAILGNKAGSDARRDLSNRATATTSVQAARAELFFLATLATSSALVEDPTLVLDAAARQWTNAQTVLHETRENLVATGDSEDVAAFDEVLGVLYAAIGNVQPVITSIAEHRATPESLSALGSQTQTSAAQAINLLNGIVDSQQEKLLANQREADRVASVSLSALIVASLAAFITGCAALAFLTASVLRPLASLQRSVQAIAGGDLDAEADVSGPTEVASLARDFNEMMAARRLALDQIESSLREKEVLLKEIHHRVKNNLQVVSSLLNLQAARTHDGQTDEVFRESQNRIRSMALVHEKLYRAEDVARIDFSDYARSLAGDLLRSYGVDTHTIELKVDGGEVLMSVEKAAPCGLLLNELVSNSLKHAFLDGRTGEIHIELHPDGDDTLSLTVGDNGVGFPADLDFRNTSSLGLQLVNALAGQLGGTVELDRDGGTEFRISFLA